MTELGDFYSLNGPFGLYEILHFSDRINRNQNDGCCNYWF